MFRCSVSGYGNKRFVCQDQNWVEGQRKKDTSGLERAIPHFQNSTARPILKVTNRRTEITSSTVSPAAKINRQQTRQSESEGQILNHHSYACLIDDNEGNIVEGQGF